VQAFLLSLENFSQLRFNSTFFSDNYLHAVLGNDLPPSQLSPIYLRRSVVFDLAKPEGVKAATRAMLGLRRFLLSGEARVETIQKQIKGP
jgi:hypothetical protein